MGRGLLVGGLIGVMALVASGCSLGTKGDRKAAVEVAERVYPGVLKVIGSRSLFPETTGAEVAFRVVDDPDAVVRLRIQGKKGTCDGKPCDRVLAEAVAKGRAKAAEYRLMNGVFGRCGYEVLGLDEMTGGPFIVATPTNANVTSLLGEIGECVRLWSEALGQAGTPVPEGRSLTVKMVGGAVARDRPSGDAGRPTMLRMTDRRLILALIKRPHYSVNYTVRGGAIDPAGGTARLERSFDQRQAFAQRIQAAAGTWLRTSIPNVTVTEYTGIWNLEPGTVDRLRGFVLFCERAVHPRSCNGDRAVAVTADLQGNPVGDFRIVEGPIRDDRGVLRLPRD